MYFADAVIVPMRFLRFKSGKVVQTATTSRFGDLVRSKNIIAIAVFELRNNGLDVQDDGPTKISHIQKEMCVECGWFT